MIMFVNFAVSAKVCIVGVCLPVHAHVSTHLRKTLHVEMPCFQFKELGHNSGGSVIAAHVRPVRIDR